MVKNKNKLRTRREPRFPHIFLAISSLIFIFPLVLSFMVSITDEASITANGYQLIPEAYSLEAYKFLFTSYGSSMARAMILTIGCGIINPLVSVFLTMCMAYPLSQPDFLGREFWRKFLVVTMLFSGGLVPSYILNVRYLHLKDTVFIYLIPGVAAWNVFLFRTFFVNIDKAMVESAKLDGANKMRVLLSIMLPLTKPLVAMIFFTGFLGHWNDITTPLYYISDRRLYTIQYLLQEMLRSTSETLKLMRNGMSVSGAVGDMKGLPIESTRFALAVIGAVPVVILFPFLQKYYAKGIMIGSTKG